MSNPQVSKLLLPPHAVATALTPEEALSALADGELDDSACAEWFTRLPQGDPGAMACYETWASYRAIGEAIRAGAPDWRSHNAFLEAMWEKQTRTPAAPDQALFSAQARDSIAGTGARQSEAANEALFRWRWVAGLAVVAGSGLLGWTLGTTGAWTEAPLAAGPKIGAEAVAAAGAGAGATGASAAGRMLRDPQLDEIMAAHRQGGVTGLAAPAGFMRAATFDSVRGNTR